MPQSFAIRRGAALARDAMIFCSQLKRGWRAKNTQVYGAGVVFKQMDRESTSVARRQVERVMKRPAFRHRNRR